MEKSLVPFIVTTGPLIPKIKLLELIFSPALYSTAFSNLIAKRDRQVIFKA
jgi:hypothetical protein